MSDPFEGLFSDEDALKFETAFLELEKDQQSDPYMVWRISVNIALANEGINISWPENDDDKYAFVVVQPIIMDESIKDYEKIPLIHMCDLFEFEDNAANPKGVAAYIKSVLYDKRFRLWKYEEDDESLA